MKILKRVFIIIILLLIVTSLSIELFYQYKVNQIEPKKLLSQNNYSSTAHEILWVYNKEKGKIDLEKFSATKFALNFGKISILNNPKKYTSSFPKGLSVISNVARNQLINNTSISQGDWHLKNLILSVWVSKHYSKIEALNYVLDTMWFGHNIHGLFEASLFYYNKNINKLTTSEIISLLAIAHSPIRLSPYINPKKHIAKAKEIAKKLKLNWPIKYKDYSYTFPTFSSKNKQNLNE